MTLNLERGGWKRCILADVVRNRNDYFEASRDGVLPYVAGPHIDPDFALIQQYGSTGDDNFPPTFRRCFERGDVLLHSRGIEKIGVVDRRGVTGEKLFVLRAIDSDVLDQQFLPWLLISPASGAYFRANFSGSVNKFLNWRPLALMEFDLPPLDEQRRIADLLWAVERYRLALRDRLVKGAQAVNVSLSSWWRIGAKKAISDIANCVTGSTPSKANRFYWDSADVPFYTPSEIIGDTMVSARQRVSLAGAKAGRMLQANAVAVACIGGDMGKSAVITEPGISNQQITAVVGLSEGDAYLLQALLAHPEGRAVMDARETTTIVRKLNKSDLMKVEVPWPDDREAMQVMVASHRRSAKAVADEFAGLSILRSALLADIFGRH